jgi:hypothetical protein
MTGKQVKYILRLITIISCPICFISCGNNRESCVSECTADRCDDGCGGICDCPLNTECNNAGKCVALVDCESAERECGSINGESCGVCEAGLVCDKGKCAFPSSCDGGAIRVDGGDCLSDTECLACEDLGWVCGEACGEICGMCDEGEICKKGFCICEPICDDTNCGSDGCGGVCECPENTLCNGERLCVENTICTDTCEDFNLECGEVCGNTCGLCKDGEECVNGVCVCNPTCDGSHCGDDGCGELCECSGDFICDAEFDCVEPTVCEETCDVMQFECGDVCGENCGYCSTDEQCSEGLCICNPVCDGSHCGINNCDANCYCNDGYLCNASFLCVEEGNCSDSCSASGAVCGTICGQSCGACESNQACLEGECIDSVNCPDCTLILALVETRTTDSNRYDIVLDLNYMPHEEEPRARMLDLFLRSDPAMELVAVEEGPAITEAGKNLSIDDSTGNPWTEIDRGRYRFVVISESNTSDFVAGRMMRFQFSTSAEIYGTVVQFELERHYPIFVPESADLVLQISPYDTPTQVIVSQSL